MLKQCEFRVKCIVFIFVLIAVVYTGIGCRSSSSSEYQQRLQGMLLASAVADAMGGPHEGRSTEDSQAFLENGGWIQSFDAYTVWHHHHWNVYQRRAPAGTVTDDTRMRMDMTAFMIDYRKLYNSPLSEKDLASCVAERYSRARKAFERTDARYAAVSQPDSALDETRKQQFLAMWFAWEIFKTGTSVYIPEPAVTSPPYIRVSDDPDYGEYTPVWHLEPVQPVPVTESIKQTYHFNSYAKGHVMPLGLIHLLPAAAYFPGAPAEAYSYALSIDFFDVAEAPHYVGAACAILADLLGGRSWPEISAELMRSSLAT
ncbi:MAG: ADP-ribosylglycohydrolase family protein [candidate division KSB1 bacterium]|nr:ADP-ribosylglycohydrolase family protein [candidate division KSB1 bacterium]